MNHVLGMGLGDGSVAILAGFDADEACFRGREWWGLLRLGWGGAMWVGGWVRLGGWGGWVRVDGRDGWGPVGMWGWVGE